MTNVSGSPEKVRLRRRLFRIGVETLEKQGWRVEKLPRRGKSSLRRITKGQQSLEVAIRTSQDTYVSFPRNGTDSGWVTLSDVDAVVVVSVDDRFSPKFALVHLISGDEMRERFDRAYAARRAAGHSIPVGRGVWVPMYVPDTTSPPAHVGGGAGLKNREIAKVPLGPEERASTTELPEAGEDDSASSGENMRRLAPITIAEAKRSLALTFGVPPESIKITVEA